MTLHQSIAWAMNEISVEISDMFNLGITVVVCGLLLFVATDLFKKYAKKLF